MNIIRQRLFNTQIKRFATNEVFRRLASGTGGMGSNYAVKITPDFDNPKWIKRHRHMFDFLDINGNGKITLNELVSKASDDICKNLEATPEQTARHEEAVIAFFRGAGMEFDKEVEWPEYLEGWKRLATNELEKHAKNQTTLIRLWGDAFFDILDKDQNGTLDVEEWKKYTQVSGLMQDDEDALLTFKHCDLDGSGKLDVDEMTRQHLGFWYSLDPTADGLYGKAVP